MDSPVLKIGIFLALVSAVLGLLYFAHSRPGYFGNAEYLGGFIFLQLLIATVWNFRQAYFPFLMIAFVWAGTDVPLEGAWLIGRWAVLGAGAVAGLVVFLKDGRYRFGFFHALALISVLSAFFSATISQAPSVALLKATSLALLFLYAASGGRLTILGREAKFFRGLLLACEVIVYLTALAYLVLHLETWGNPNSLGLVMGVVMAPLLLWGILVSEPGGLQSRRTVAFLLAVVLLFMSVARASIVASAASMFVLCIVLRRYKLLVQGAAVVLCVIAALAILAPSKLENLTSESTSRVVYKGKREAGLMGSRRSPWQTTMNTVSAHPWFGVGFGTTVSQPGAYQTASFASNQTITREHGNSYLAILEWMGWLGVIPFYAMVLFLLAKIARVLRWIRSHGGLHHPCVPLIAVLTAALVHATFEDWLFAVGYYMCVFFWSLAFVLIDLVPATTAAVNRSAYAWPNTRLGALHGVMTSGR